MTSYSYGTLGGNAHSIVLTPSIGEDRPKTPSGLVVTRAVETKDGWRGQVLVDKEIVFETDPIFLAEDTETPGEDAIKAANARVVQVIRRLFEAEDDA